MTGRRVDGLEAGRFSTMSGCRLCGRVRPEHPARPARAGSPADDAVRPGIPVSGSSSRRRRGAGRQPRIRPGRVTRVKGEPQRGEPNGTHRFGGREAQSEAAHSGSRELTSPCCTMKAVVPAGSSCYRQETKLWSYPTTPFGILPPLARPLRITREIES